MGSHKKKIFNKLFIIILLSAICYLLSAKLALASTFNPNFIISDAEILDSTTMTLADIQGFLISKGSYLAHYTTQNADGVFKTAAEIIYDAAVNNYDCDNINLSTDPTEAEKKLKCQPAAINPKLLLVLLQKEQSLIEDSSPDQSQLDWATGYGCPDNAACNPRWKSFGKQVNSAALQFFDYMTSPHHYTYQVGKAYTATNNNRPDIIIVPANQATAALYNYTPHVYDGNYNFFKLWLKYFSRNYLDGSLLQVEGEPGVWLIQDGKKRPFLTKGALTSRYDPGKIITVNKTDIDKYLTGAPIKFPQYSLLRSPRGTVFLLVDDKRRGFKSAEALRKIGYNPEEIIEASWEDINVYEEGEPITATSTFPTGALLQDSKTGGVYWVSEATKAPVWDRIFLTTKFKYKAIHPIEPEKLASYKTVNPVIFDDGELLKSLTSPAVYVIANGQKRALTSPKVFEELGYKWENIITVPKKIIDLYNTGELITEVVKEEAEEVIEPTEDSTTATSTEQIPSLEEEIQDILNP